jgi:hypothetical protein
VELLFAEWNKRSPFPSRCYPRRRQSAGRVSQANTTSLALIAHQSQTEAEALGRNVIWTFTHLQRGVLCNLPIVRAERVLVGDTGPLRSRDLCWCCSNPTFCSSQPITCHSVRKVSGLILFFAKTWWITMKLAWGGLEHAWISSIYQ